MRQFACGVWSSSLCLRAAAAARWSKVGGNGAVAACLPLLGYCLI